jgi:predicted AAA+ superfamily ATPase
MQGEPQMRRLIMKDLIEWKNRKNRKPLILKGVRQSGKTFILNQFGRENYVDIAYFNFESEPSLSNIFSEDLDPVRIITELSINIKKPVNPQTTLVFFDEIQFCNKAITSLKYFCEQLPEYHIVCAGSLIGIAMSKPLSYPVGKVDVYTLYPMSFQEYVLANDENMLVEYINNLDFNTSLSKIFANKLISYLKIYFITGGMPEAVSNWLENRDISETERILDDILNLYLLDFAKHAPAEDFPKLSLIWKSIPEQLAKDNERFFFGHAKKGARAKDLEDAIEWLISAGMVYKVCRISKPFTPLSTYSNNSLFKLFLSDVGLLRKMSGLSPNSILKETNTYTEFKGALTENYILNELIKLTGKSPYFWKSGNTAEVDFIIQTNDMIIPLEVKSSVNVKSKSLSVYREKYQPDLSLRTSLLNLKKESNLINIPLYMFWTIKNIKQ